MNARDCPEYRHPIQHPVFGIRSGLIGAIEAKYIILLQKFLLILRKYLLY